MVCYNWPITLSWFDFLIFFLFELIKIFYYIYIYIYTKNFRLISERCGLAAFLSGSLLHIYEKQTTWCYTFVNYKCYQPQENIRKQREILAHKYNHAQLQTQENAWKTEMKSLQDKYTRNKTRKLTTLWLHVGCFHGILLCYVNSLKYNEKSNCHPFALQ
jgi:hypothetical protein